MHITVHSGVWVPGVFCSVCTLRYTQESGSLVSFLARAHHGALWNLVPSYLLLVCTPRYTLVSGSLVFPRARTPWYTRESLQFSTARAHQMLYGVLVPGVFHRRAHHGTQESWSLLTSEDMYTTVHFGLWVHCVFHKRAHHGTLQSLVPWCSSTSVHATVHSKVWFPGVLPRACPSRYTLKSGFQPSATDVHTTVHSKGPHGLAFTRRGCFSTKLAHSFLSHLCLSFCLPESFTCTSFHPSTSPDISAVFELGLSFLSTPAFHLYFSFIQAFFLPLLFFSVVH